MRSDENGYFDIGLEFGVPRQGLGYRSLVFANTPLEKVSREKEDKYAVFAHIDDQTSLVYSESPAWNESFKFLNSLLIAIGDYNIVLYKNFAGNFVRIFDYYPPYFLSAEQIIRHIRFFPLFIEIKNTMKSFGIDWKQCQSVTTENKYEYEALFSLVERFYFSFTGTIGNFYIWIPNRDFFIVLCHEGDIHLFFRDTLLRDTIFDISQSLGMIDNTELFKTVREYYPCS